MKEPDLFYAFKEHYVPNLKVAVDVTNPFDAICHTAKIVVEFKSRSKHFQELLIEWKKYEQLLNRAADRGYTPVYICATPKGVWAWNLMYKDLDWFYLYLPIETKSNIHKHNNNTRIRKQVAYLDIEDGSYLHKIEVR